MTPKRNILLDVGSGADISFRNYFYLDDARSDYSVPDEFCYATAGGIFNFPFNVNLLFRITSSDDTIAILTRSLIYRIECDVAGFVARKV